MTTKEKAKELVERFRKLEDGESWINNYNAKQCALICVDELISLNYRVKKEIEHKFNMNYWIKEWEEVKQEIEKL